MESKEHEGCRLEGEAMVKLLEKADLNDVVPVIESTDDWQRCVVLCGMGLMRYASRNGAFVEFECTITGAHLTQQLKTLQRVP